MERHLNIITLNIPYPPDYGGMIDTFYRIKALHNTGIHIHLHCFEYDRSRSDEIMLVCDSVNYYKRENSLISQLTLLPFIVSSRRSSELLKNLVNNDFPILFDGLHTTFFLGHDLPGERLKLVRPHNIEHLYYKSLARFERNLFRKIYFTAESMKLKRFEKILLKADVLLPISLTDLEHFKKTYHRAELTGPFHPYDHPVCTPGSGKYLIYHGDMSVRENAITAGFLISDIFSRIDFPCVIAGKRVPGKILRTACRFKHIRIVADPDFESLDKLIREAHVHVLPALNSNGFKIKLLMALYGGRHCLVNRKMVNGTMLSPLCNLAETPREFIEKINFLKEQPFTESMLKERKALLNEYYNNTANAKKLAGLIFPGQEY